MLVKSQVKYIQSLADKKFRDAEGVFVAEGPKIVRELLQCGSTQAVAGFAVGAWLRENEAFTGEKKGFTELSQRELERISFLTTPNQVLAVFRKPQFPLREKEKGISLLIDNMQDPGNLGTVIRTADWFNACRLVCSPDTVDLFNPKVVQASMGSVARVEVIYRDLKEYIEAGSGIPLYAAVMDGEPLGQKISVPEAMILIGNESRGIQPGLAALAARRIRIPGTGEAESLNVAVAAGILLFMIQKA